MNEITEIRPAVRKENRANIFIDGKFAFSLDLAQVVEFKLKVGQQIMPDERRRLEKASSFGKLYQRTLEWVFARPRSVRETHDYLRRKKFQKPEYGITDEDIENVVRRLLDKGYLNDRTFARYYAENRFLKKGVATKRLRLELAKKGVDKGIVDEVLADLGRDDVTEVRKMIAKKRRLYPDDEKLIAYLVRQGFDFELARSAVRETD